MAVINSTVGSSVGSPLKSPMRKLSFSNKTKSPGRSPQKGAGKSPMKGLINKDISKDTPFSSAVFKEWRAKYGSKDDAGYHCLVCPKSFALDSSLKRHYKNVHELVCKCCNMQFAEEHQLKEHHKEKHEYWCHPCNKVFTLRSSLIRHDVQQHGAESPQKLKSEQREQDIKFLLKFPQVQEFPQVRQNMFPSSPSKMVNGGTNPCIDKNVLIPAVDIDYQGLRHEDIVAADDEYTTLLLYFFAMLPKSP